MTPDALQDLKREYERHKAARGPVEQLWDQIEKFVDPLGNGRLAQGVDSENDVLWKRIEVWDFAAIEGKQKLQATIHATVTNPAVQWFTAEFRDVELQQDQASREWLEDTIGRAYQALQDSDFNTEIAVNDGDLVAYGNGFIICEAKGRQRWEGLDFTCIPVREAYFERDSYGMVKRFYRHLTWSARQIIDRCGEEHVPDEIREEALKPEGGLEHHEVVFAIYPRDNGAEIWDEKGAPVMLAPELRPIGSVYFLAGSGEQCGEDGGYYEMPAFHSPWEETAGSQWGHGVGGLVLPTVKLLNALWEVYLGAAEKAVDPAMMATERGVLGDVDLGPGGLTIVRDIEKSLRALESGAKFEVTYQLLMALQSMIRKAFHEDELQLKESPAMTATEAAIRFEVMNRVMSSVLSRMQSCQLSPIIHLVIAILYREGRLKPAPELVRRKRGEINIVYLGPLSRAQRTDEVAAIERGFSFVSAARKMGFEEAADVFDAAEAAREVFKRLGVPATCLKSKEEVTEIAKQRQAQMAAARKAELARAQGEAVEQAGKAGMAMREGMGAAPPASMPAAPPPMLAPTLEGAPQ